MLLCYSRSLSLFGSLVLGALPLVAATYAPEAGAEEVDSATRSAARDLGYEGVQAYQKGDYETATDRLERAYSVVQAPSLALWSARALEKSGQLVEASERYLEATRLPVDSGGDPAVQEKAKADARKERAELRERIPRVIVELQGIDDPDQATVTIDGVVVASALFGAGRPTNPGDIEVVATWGRRKVSGTVHLDEGETKTINLAFKKGAASAAPAGATEGGGEPAGEERQPAPAAATSATPEDAGSGRGGSWQTIAGWSAVGVGAAGLALGGVMGGMAMSTEGDLIGCQDGRCPPGNEGALSDYDTYRTVSTVGFIAGGVLAAAGVTLLLLPPKDSDVAYVSPYVGGTSAGLHGKF